MIINKYIFILILLIIIYYFIYKNDNDNDNDNNNNNDNQKLPSRANQEPTFKGYLLEPEPYDDSDEDEEAKTHANYFDWKIKNPIHYTGC